MPGEHALRPDVADRNAHVKFRETSGTRGGRPARAVSVFQNAGDVAGLAAVSLDRIDAGTNQRDAKAA